MTDWLEEIEARAEAATPGPWYPKATDDALCMNARYVSLDPGEWAHDNETFMAEPTAYDRVVAITMLQYPRLACLDDAKWDENTEFIAHARTDIPRLIARVRELEAQAAADAKVADAKVADAFRALVQKGAPERYDFIFAKSMCSLCGGEIDDVTEQVAHRDDCTWAIAVAALAARDAAGKGE